MKQKQVSQLNQDGYFIGVTVADESPLEPGVFLFPANSVDSDPPFVPQGKRAKWVEKWVIEDIPPPPTPPAPPPLTPEEQRELQIAQLRINLAQTDYKVLPDYDKPNEDIKKQRQAWRDEIRSLGG